MKIERKMPIDRYYFLRKVDELSRVVIPIEIRKELKINENDEVKIFINKFSFTDKIDAIGRIKLPLDIREELGIKVTDTLKTFIHNGDIVLENEYIR